MRILKALVLLPHIFLYLALAQFAMAEGLSPSGPVQISADQLSYTEGDGTYQAEGEVHIKYDDVTLQADKAVFNRNDGEAIVSGNVVMEKEGDVLHGDHLKLNTVTQQGEIANGTLFVKKPNFHIHSNRMSKLGKDDYRMERGSFTTCDGDSPSWRFTARDLEVTLEEYATGKDVLFYIKDVPLLYLPYIVFPVKQERQSGFLLPRIGNSSKKGFNLDLPFYWAITPSQDAVFNLDIQTKRGVGTGIDYRYIVKGGSEGSVGGYGIYDTSQSRFRGKFNQRHVDATSDSLTFRSDINLISDRDFYRDFADAAGEYNRQYLDSRAALTKKWQDHVLTAELNYIENMDAVNNDSTLQQLPSVSFTSIKRKLGKSPFFFSLDSNVTNFYREQGAEGQRLNLHPTVTAYFQPARNLDVAAFAGYRQRLYNAHGGNRGNETDGEGFADAGISLSSRFARIFDTGLQSVPKVRHLLLPEIAYSFIQEKNQDELPFFDYEDRILGQNLVSLSLTNYFTGKFQQADGSSLYREIMFLRLSQGYQASGSRRDLLTLVDEGRSLTDLRLETRFSPVAGLSMDLDSRFNTYRGRFSHIILNTDFRGENDNRLGVGYHFSHETLKYLEGRVGVGLVKPLVFNYTGRYSFDKGDFLESTYAIEYKHQCWGITFSYRDRPDNREFMVTFTLAGIGAVGPLKTF